MSSAIDEAAAMERRPVLVDLALQGGGSHGAFTWGVLDRLLEEPWIKIEAISGTSAGAMNAAVLGDGWSRGGADSARTRLIPRKVKKIETAETTVTYPRAG
jgi:NTE family protein